MFVAKRKQNELTKLTLLLVWWVICVCLANNIGLLSACSAKYNNTHQAVEQLNQSADDHYAKCDLSEHLINFEQLQIAQYALVMLFFAFALCLGLLASFHSLPLFTEPILHKGRRLHLTLCVFRE